MTCTAECRPPRMNTKEAHCSACHKTFSGVTWLDVHRIGGRCNDVPSLVEVDGLWATKERHEWNVIMWERLRQLREERPT